MNAQLALGFLFVFLFSFTTTIHAQSCDYQTLMREGQALFNKNQYRAALKKYNAARTCDPSKSAEVNAAVDRVFDAIEDQREAALKAERRAVENYNKLQEANQKTAEERAKAKVSALLAETAEAGKKAKEDSLRQEREKLERISRSSHNISLANKLMDRDPTLAMRIAEYNAKRHPEDYAAQITFRNILSDTTLRFCRKRFSLDLENGDSVSSVAVHRERRLIAYGTMDGKVKVFDFDGNVVAAFEAFSIWITGIAFNRTGDQLYIISPFTELRKYEIDGRLVKTWDVFEPGNGIAALSISPDERFIAVAGSRGWVKVIDPEGGVRFAGQVFPTTDLVWYLEISNDGQTLLAKSLENDRILAVNWPTGTAVMIRQEKNMALLSHSISGDRFYTISYLGKLSVLDKKGSFLFSFDTEIYNPSAIDIEPQSGDIYVSGNTMIKRFDAFGRLLETFNTGAMTPLQVWREGDLLAAAGNKDVRSWHSRDQEIRNIKISDKELRQLLIDSETGRLCIAGKDSELFIADSNGVLLQTLRFDYGKISSVAIGKGGKLFAAGGEQGVCRLWNEEGKVVATLKGHKGEILSLIIASDGQTVISAAQDSTLRLWNLKGVEVLRLKGCVSHTVALSGDGKNIIYASPDSAIHVFGIGEKRELKKWKTPRQISQIRSGAKHLLVTDFAGGFAVFDMEGKTLVDSNFNRGYNVNAVECFGGFVGSTGDSVLVVNFDKPGQLALWSVSRGKCFSTEQARGVIRTALWTKIGRYFSVTASGDYGMIRTFDSNGNERVVQKGHRNSVNSCGQNKSQNIVYTVGDDGVLSIRKNLLRYADSVYAGVRKVDLALAGATLEPWDLNSINSGPELFALMEYYDEMKSFDRSLPIASKFFRGQRDPAGLAYLSRALYRTGRQLEPGWIGAADSNVVRAALNKLMVLNDFETINWLYVKCLETDRNLAEQLFYNLTFKDNVFPKSRKLNKYYSFLAKFGEKLIATIPDAKVPFELKTALARNYANLGYYLLKELQDLAGFEKAQKRGLELDPNRRGLLTNQAYLLFFEKQFDDLKSYIKSIGKKEYAPDAGLPTFADAMRSEFQSLESAGLITPELRPHYNEIMKMLEEK